MKELLVGCPISHRAWILPRWHDHVAEAARQAGVSVSYAFVADPQDTFTLSAIERLPAPAVIDHVSDGRLSDTRTWDHDRYRHMVGLRNRLLQTVRMLDPPWFLSLDSDILLHPLAVANMLESTDRFDIVGGRTYMTPSGVACPSWGFFAANGGIRRLDATGVFAVEIVMALKLLTPKAYGVEYSFHTHGEDLGFSKNAREAGLRLGVDARVASKHVMGPEHLDREDVRCGF